MARQYYPVLDGRKNRLKELKRLELRDRNTLIPSQLLTSASKLEWISLDGNYIPVLTPYLLRNKKRLSFLSLSECEIEAVLDSTFIETKKLEFLILKNNNLKQITAGQLKGLESLNYIGKLRVVTLEHWN